MNEKPDGSNVGSCSQLRVIRSGSRPFAESPCDGDSPSRPNSGTTSSSCQTYPPSPDIRQSDCHAGRRSCRRRKKPVWRDLQTGILAAIPDQFSLTKSHMKSARLEKTSSRSVRAASLSFEWSLIAGRDSGTVNFFRLDAWDFRAFENELEV